MHILYTYITLCNLHTYITYIFDIHILHTNINTYLIYIYINVFINIILKLININNGEN